MTSHALAMASENNISSFTRATDSIKGAVFITKRAKTIAKRRDDDENDDDDANDAECARATGAGARDDAPRFGPILRDESERARRARGEAYATCWREIDAHIAEVLARANADAFTKVRAFVEETHAERAARAASGRLATSCRVPVGVVLAGGVNSDDHEETFAALVTYLRRRGDAHCALLRSRDLKARAGVGTGGVGVAFGVVLRQLDRTGAHWGGKSMRAVKRWHDDASAERVERLAPAERGDDGGDGDDAWGGTDARALAIVDGDALGDDGDVVMANTGSKKRGKSHANANAARKTRRKNNRRDTDANEGREDDAYLHTVIGRDRPVVIVVEDTEGFDARVLDSFLLSVAEYASSVPVIVMLGLATSVSSLQGMLPAATAALLHAHAFQLWAPGQMMEAVQEQVLLSPERAPAFGSAVLNALHTRFKEHDFSLAAVRRALHLLTLTHFMTEPLSAVCPLLTRDASAPYAGGEDSDDEYADAVERFVDNLDAQALEYAHKKYNFATKRDLIIALRDVYRLRRRWKLALRCIHLVCVATEEKFKKRATTTMADLLLDASRAEYFSEDVKSPGTHLINVTCARLCDGFSTEEIAALAKEMLKHLDEDEVMRGAEGSELKFLLMRVDDGSIAREDDDAKRRKSAQEASDAKNASNGVDHDDPYAAMDEPTPTTSNDENVRRDVNAKNADKSVDIDGDAAALEAMMNARRGRGAATGRSSMGTGATTTTGDGGLVLPVLSPASARSTPRALAIVRSDEEKRKAAEEQRKTADRQLSLVVAEEERQRDDDRRLDASASSAATAFCGVLRAVARKYASRPPESLAASGLFVITDVDCVRYALQASPRLTLENTLVDPSEVLGCSCCRRDAYDLHAARKIPKSLPDTAAAYRLLAIFGEQANIHDWFQRFCALHAPSSSSAKAAAPSTSSTDATRGKGTFGLTREKLWELQARFTRAVAELEFLGIARPHQKGRKGVEFMVRTAFPLDKLQRDATKVVTHLALPRGAS